MTMTIKLAPDMEQQLRRRSEAQGRPASALIREALAAYLADPGEPQPSAYELGQDLFGKYRGSADLASRRKALVAEAWDAKHQARKPAPSGR